MVLHVAMLRCQTAHTLVIAEQPGVSGAAVTLFVGGAKQALQMLLLRCTPTFDLYTSSFLAASWQLSGAASVDLKLMSHAGTGCRGAKQLQFDA